MMITLQAWAYDHIIFSHPCRLPIPSFSSHEEYLASIMRWIYNFYFHPIDGIQKDVKFYQTMLAKLIPYNVRFRMYHLYPAWDELKDELIGIYQAWVLSGR